MIIPTMVSQAKSRIEAMQGHPSQASRITYGAPRTSTAASGVRRKCVHEQFFDPKSQFQRRELHEVVEVLVRVKVT
jgi:hypothetical protein